MKNLPGQIVIVIDPHLDYFGDAELLRITIKVKIGNREVTLKQITEFDFFKSHLDFIMDKAKREIQEELEKLKKGKVE